MKIIKRLIVMSLFIMGVLPVLAKDENISTRKEVTEASRKGDYFFMEGLRQLALNKNQEALDLFIKSLDYNPKNPAVYMEMSSILMQNNHYKDAIGFLEIACQLDSTNYWHNIALADLYGKLGLYPQALDVYERLHRNFPNRENVLYMLALLYAQKQDYIKSLQTWEKLENIIGQNEIVDGEKNKIYERICTSMKKESDLEQLVADYPNNAYFILALTNSYMNNNEYKKAEKLLQKSVKINPQEEELLLGQVEFYVETGNEKKSNSLFLSIFRNKEISMGLKERLYEQYIEEQDTSKSVNLIKDIYEILSEEYPNEAFPETLYGSYLYFIRDKENAALHFRESIAMDKNQPLLWVYLIEIANEKEDKAESYRLIEEANILFSEEPEFHFYRTAMLIEEKRYDEALKELEEAEAYMDDRNPAFKSMVYSTIADLKYRKKEVESALLYYDKAVKENPKNYLALNNYSYTLAEENRDIDKAEKMILEVLTVVKNESYVLDTYAWVLFRQGNYSLAEMFIVKALSVSNYVNYEEVEHYGDILIKKGSVEKAIEMWKKSIELGNPSEKIKEKISKKMYIE